MTKSSSVYLIFMGIVCVILSVIWMVQVKNAHGIYLILSGVGASMVTVGILEYRRNKK